MNSHLTKLTKLLAELAVTDYIKESVGDAKCESKEPEQTLGLKHKECQDESNRATELYTEE